MIFKVKTPVFRTIFCGLLLFSSAFSTAQVRNELIWQSQLDNDSDELYRKNYVRVQRGGYKLHLDPLNYGEIIVSFTDLATLTRTIPGRSDGIAFNYQSKTGQSKEIFIKRTEIDEQLQSTLEIHLDDYISRVRIRGSIDDYKKKERKDFKQVLKGKKLGVKWKDYSWPIKVGDIEDLNSLSPYSLSFICKKIPYASIHFDSLYSDLTPILPQLDNEACEPFDRFTYYRKYFGLEYKGFSYRPYRPRSGYRKKKNFRLFFDKASSTYDQKEIDNIIKYLNDSNLVIESAKVLAFASVEGDSAINMQLQQERATILMRSLEKANNDSIEISLATREDWGLFRSQLSNTPFKDRYTEKEWKELFENDSIEARFEKYLRQQRRAELYLSLTQRLSEEQKVKVAFYDFNRYVKRYQPQARPEVRWRQIKFLYAIKKYLDIQVARGEANKDEVCSLLPPTINEYHVINFYETVKIIREDQEPICDNLEQIVLTAHLASLDLIDKHSDRLYLQQALDIQSFTFEMVARGKLDPSILCKLNYPDEPKYYNLILNQLFFRDHQGSTVYQALPCLESFRFPEGHGLYASVTDSLVALENTPSSYYYVLKKIVLEDDEQIKELVNRSDHILQFDIFEFLFYNISNWRVWEDVLFDKEVTPEIMDQQLARLRSMKGLICPNQISALTLKYYLKVMQSSLVKAREDRLTAEAIDFVSHYYQARAEKMSDGMALMIAKQLMAMTPLYFHNEPAREAYDVLRLRNWKRPLKGEALNYYVNLVNLVSRDREERLNALKQNIPENTWNSFYEGKYSLPTN